jgi:hypothetical protein
VERRSNKYPKARLAIPRILVLQGAIDEAAVELRDYLESGNADKRQEAESWLEQLQR